VQPFEAYDPVAREAVLRPYADHEPVGGKIEAGGARGIAVVRIRYDV
jgi:hypothetical protein